jgi:alkylation response protein AidB-like acyl-CoA dehydrogenase
VSADAGQAGDEPLGQVRDELRAVARELLGKTRGASPSWAVLASSGWTGLEVPETLDGAGASFAETAVICEELGRAASASPFLGAAVLGVGTLLALVPSPSRDGLLRATASGESVPVAVLPGGPAEATPFRLERAADGRPRLHGTADFVPGAAEADVLLVISQAPAPAPAQDPVPAPARGSAPAPSAVSVPSVVVVVRPGADGVSAEVRPVLDETRGLARVRADGAEVPESSVWRFAGDPAAAVAGLADRAAVALACDSLGVAGAMLDATVSYVQVRQQFGRAIGSFQAVKHACADMLVQVTVARQLVAEAVTALAAGPAPDTGPVPDTGPAASMAKSYACAAAVEVAGKAMQLHGGVGYARESGVHAYLKRAALNRDLFGSPAAHRARLARRYQETEEPWP